MLQRRGPTAVVVFAALVGVLLVTWAATIGPSGVVDGEGPLTGTEAPSPTPSSEAPSGTTQPTPFEDVKATDSAAADVIALVVRIFFSLATLALIALLTYAIYRALRRMREAMAERRGESDPDAIGFEVLGSPERVARAMSEDADQQRALLGEGTPRNGIVRCWRRFEEVAAEAGVPRKEWETPGEFALRMLAAGQAEEDAAYRLTLLYREARFSHHELDESARDEALEALAAIHAGLIARSGSLS